MFYKGLTPDTHNIDDIEYLQINTSYDETKYQLLINAIENFETEIGDSEDNLKTICSTLQEYKYNIDPILSKCKAIETMIQYLDSQDISFVHKNLITLNILAPISKFTMRIINENMPAFINLLTNFSNCIAQNENIEISMDSIVLLCDICKNIIQFDKIYPPDGEPKLILQMISSHRVVDIIIEIFNSISSSQSVDKPPSNNILQLSSRLISILELFLQNLTKEEMRKPIEGSPTVDKIFSIVQQFLLSADPLLLMPTLELFQLIIFNSLDNITVYLNKDICDRIIDLINESDSFGESRIQILLKLIDVIHDFVLKIEKIERYEGFIESILQNLLKKLHFEESEDYPVDEELITRLLATLQLISKSKSTAEILIKSQAIQLIAPNHDNFNFVLKNQFHKILFGVSKYYPLELCESCRNFLPDILYESFTNIYESMDNIDINSVEFFLQAIFHLISQDREVFADIETNDMEEFMELLSTYRDKGPETFDICDRLIQFFEDEDDADPGKLLTEEVGKK